MFILLSPLGTTLRHLLSCFKKFTGSCHEQITFTNVFPALGMVLSRLKTRLVLDDRQSPERMKTSWTITEQLTNLLIWLGRPGAPADEFSTRNCEWNELPLPKWHDPAYPTSLFTWSRSLRLFFLKWGKSLKENVLQIVEEAKKMRR